VKKKFSKTVALIVAHPDDETLWAGGTILSHPAWKFFIVCLCRGSDAERTLRFHKALKSLHSEGIIGDLNDDSDQKPLDDAEVEQTILRLLPPKPFDLLITHNPGGEYTKHLRHEEISKAVISLWSTGKVTAEELWTFAYEDGNKGYLPRPVKNAHYYQAISTSAWLQKYKIITEIYGFKKDSWESETTPKSEAFWQLTNPENAINWIKKYENISII